MSRSDNIIARFREIASRHPYRPALIVGETHYSYQDLTDLTCAYVTVLRDKLSLDTGQILLAWLDNGPEFVASFLAAASTGAVFFPLNINLRPPELRWFLDRLPVSGVVTRQALRAPWDSLADHVPPERVIAADNPLIRPIPRTSSGLRLPPLSNVQTTSDQPVVYLCSSGSTGVPKIIPRSHSNIITGADATASALGITPGMRFMSVVPFYHGNGFDNSLSLPLFSGATALLLPHFVPSGFIASLIHHRIQVLIASPAIFELLVRFKSDLQCLSTLMVCASSGGPIARKTMEKVRSRCGVTIRQVYGSSETGVMAVEPPGGGPPAIVVPTMDLRVIDQAGLPLPPNVEGEIAVRGPTLAGGYVDNPEMTAAAFSNGYFRTGDRGLLDPCGRLILLGRIRPLINLSGTKVDPLEIENVLLRLQDVVACRVCDCKGPQQERIIKAVISVGKGSTLTRTEVIGHCRQFLAEFKIPRVVEFMRELPADLSGKKPLSWASGES